MADGVEGEVAGGEHEGAGLVDGSQISVDRDILCLQQGQDDSGVVYAGDDGAEPLPQESEVLANEVETAGHGQNVDFGARIGDEDVAALEEAEIALEDSVVDLEASCIVRSVGGCDVGRDQLTGGTYAVAHNFVPVHVLTESRAPRFVVVGVEGGVGAIGGRDDLAVQHDRNEDVGHHPHPRLRLLLRLPDCLQMESIEDRQHVVHLNRGQTGFVDGAAQHFRHLLDAGEGPMVVFVSLSVLIGAAVVRVDAHDETRDLQVTDAGGGYAAAFEVAFHFHVTLSFRA